MRSLLLGFALASVAAAQSLTYTLLPPGPAAPTGRIDGTIAYDAPSRRIFLFGGDDGQPKNDLWAYSLAERRWEALSPSGTPPPARFGHTAIFDPVARRLVIFGGQARGFFSDVWAYEADSNTWRQLAGDQSGPSRRYGHSAIYDAPRRRMVISHGFTDAGRFDDTWAFDLATNRWTDISPPAGRPLRRCLHHAVYDALNQRMLLFGGCASGFGPCPLDDLWAYDLVNGGWRELTRTGPSGRQHYGMAYDEPNARVILFSGQGAPNDTWTFDVRANRWSQLSPANAPAARSRHQGASITDRGTTVFFGGFAGAGSTNELWTLGPAFASTPAPRFVASSVTGAFSGLAGGVAPGEIISIYGSGLGPEQPVAFSFDPLTLTLPRSGPGVDVFVNGIAAPLYYASESQLNIQVPYEVAGAATAEINVRVNGQQSDPVTVPVVRTRPSLFARAWNQDGSANSADNPAASGSVVVLYASGQGITVPASRTGVAPANAVYPDPAAPVSLTIGGQRAELLFRGQAPGTVGVMQINARLPRLAPGGHVAILAVGDAESQAVTVFVR